MVKKKRRASKRKSSIRAFVVWSVRSPSVKASARLMLPFCCAATSRRVAPPNLVMAWMP
jgi:hypothetical protein